MVRCITMPGLDLTLNGTPLRVDVREGETLLETLRTRCGVTSVKDGRGHQFVAQASEGGFREHLGREGRQLAVSPSRHHGDRSTRSACST